MSLSLGVSYEWAVLYYALRESSMSAEELLYRRQSTYNRLGPSPDRQVDSYARQTSSLLQTVLCAEDLRTGYHADELHIPGNPEPKVDLVFFQPSTSTTFSCSLKLPGAVQLTSLASESAAHLLEILARATNTIDTSLLEIIEHLAYLPQHTIARQNIPRLIEEQPGWIQPYLLPDAISVVDAMAFETYKPHLQRLQVQLTQYFRDRPDLYEAFLFEVLTGSLMFAEQPRAQANYLVSPLGLHVIDTACVLKLAPRTKIGFRAKSRRGVTSINLRVDAVV